MGAGIINGLHNLEHVQIAGSAEMGCLPKPAVAQVLYIAHMKAGNAAHAPKMADHSRYIIGRVRGQRAGTQAQGVAGGIPQGKYLVKALLAVGNAGQAENRPSGVVWMHGHYHALGLAGGNNAI